MSKYKVINLFDKLFVTISVFLIIYAWINFFIRNLIVTFFFSLIFSAAVVFLIFYIFNRKKEKTTKTKAYLKDIEEKFLAFRLMSKTNQLYLINSIIQKDYKSKIINNYIAYKTDSKTCLILIATNIEKLTEFDVINLLQSLPKVDIIEIICNESFGNVNMKILADTDIFFKTKKSLYDEYFFKHSIYPNCELLSTKKTHLNFKQIMKNFTTPNKAKSYFFCGLILIFSSIILPYHFYYLIFGSALLILSIICKLQPLFKH